MNWSLGLIILFCLFRKTKIESTAIGHISFYEDETTWPPHQQPAQESWLRFFLRGIYEVSRSASDTSRAILKLRERHREEISSQSNSSNGLLLLDHLFEHPIVTIRTVEERLDCSFVTASRLVDDFERLGLVSEITGWKRNRRYRYDQYIRLFDQQAILGDEPELTPDTPTTMSESVED